MWTCDVIPVTVSGSGLGIKFNMVKDNGQDSFYILVVGKNGSISVIVNLMLSLSLLGPSEKVRGSEGWADKVPPRTRKSSCMAGTKWRGALFPWGRRNWCTGTEGQAGGAQKGAQNTHLNNIMEMSLLLLIHLLKINMWSSELNYKLSLSFPFKQAAVWTLFSVKKMCHTTNLTI